MSEFDGIIGYDGIKTEMNRILDMMHHPEEYRKLGAALPHGLLLYGEPGTGKTTLGKAFIAESGRKAYVLRRNGGDENFPEAIGAAFAMAKENAPAIVFLDDMDKFANEDEDHPDAPEYVALQAAVDEAKDADVFVVGTVNNMHKLPCSLTRAGRFDRVLEVPTPSPEDAAKIVAYYFSKKRVDENVDLEDVGKMINYRSCAELENIANLAAIRAGAARKESIGTEDILSAVLEEQYETGENDYESTPEEEERRRVAFHEGGHLIMAEILSPGSVGLVSVSTTCCGGFVHLYRGLKRRAHNVLTALASKAAVEMYYPDPVAAGCMEDIDTAAQLIREGISSTASSGFAMLDVTTRRFPESSESFLERNETVVQAELERYYRMARDIVYRNRAFLEKTVDALMEKNALLASEIRAIRESVTIVPAA